MGRCGQLVIGPAGSGKSTYCELMRNHIETLNRRVHVVNLDPAAEHFRYPVAADIRDLISLEDVMTEMKLGPNGGLIYCMEYLIDNIDWLQARPTQRAQGGCLSSLSRSRAGVADALGAVALGAKNNQGPRWAAAASSSSGQPAAASRPTAS